MSALKEAVESLLFRYAAVIDDGDLTEWPGFFAEDAEYRLVPRENFLRGLPAALIYCKSRAMMRDRVTAIKKASVYTPHYYRHHYSNILLERSPAQLTLRANYLVCRTLDDGDTSIFSTGRVIAALPVLDDPGVAPPSSWGARGEPGAPDTAPRSIRPSAPDLAPRTIRPGPPDLAPRSFRGTWAESGPASAGGVGSGSLPPPPSRRRPSPGPVFLSMTVVYDTCRIPGLLVFPI